MNAPGPAQTIRIRWTKHGRVRFVSHRDVARIFERALRKLRLPVAYTAGFSPRPRLSFGLALTVAHESEAEYLDVDLDQIVAVEALPDALTAALPGGMTVEAVVAVPPGTPSLQQAVESCDWRIEILGVSTAALDTAIGRALAAEELPLERVRKGKPAVADVRPAILEIGMLGPTSDGVEVSARLATGQITVRPSELIQLLAQLIPGATAETATSSTGPAAAPAEGRVCRTHQWMIVDGARCEPVSRPGPSTGHAMARAS
ncbi:MAG: TIGR03936 family radical SAM-associated protein [Acidimicrobiales bacterium]